MSHSTSIRSEVVGEAHDRAPAGNLDTNGLCLLSLDGGGVRGLSTLMILQTLMAKINTQRPKPVKPCEIFDLIGGTSTGGIIAIMLGRLEMDVTECIDIYQNMFKDVFGSRKHRLPAKMLAGKIQARFDDQLLRKAILEELEKRHINGATMLEDGKERTTRSFVVATRKENKSLVRIRDYKIPGQINRDPASIVEAALATSAATTFFPSVKIGSKEYVDGALGENNPVNVVWREAQNIWCPDSKDQAELSSKVKCFISIGTGNPGTSPIKDSALGFLTDTLKDMVTQTERTATAAAENYKAWLNPRNGQRYFRFNVEQGLQNVGLEEYLKQGEIEAATDDYLEHPVQQIVVQECAGNLQDSSPFYHFRTSFSIANSVKCLQLIQGYQMFNAAEAEHKRADILKWLDYKDQSVLHDEYRRKCAPGTGRSFLDGPLREWLRSSSRLLWVSGDVGSGKTELCSLMIDRTQSILADPNPVLEVNDKVVYFYINFEDTATHSVSTLTQTIIAQLYTKYVVLPEVADSYDRLQPWKASQADLVNMLLSLLRNRVSTGTDSVHHYGAEFTSVTLFIDGVDEVAEGSVQSAILAFLRDIASEQLPNVRIVVVSRPYKAFAEFLDVWTHVSMSEAVISADIELFAKHEIEKNASFKDQSEALKAHIAGRLSRGSKGMFRLASLHMQELLSSFRGRRISQKRIDQLLDDLPLGLDAYYDRIITRIPTSMSDELHRVLKWILCAHIPMRMGDLIDACIIVPEAQVSFDQEDRLDEVDISEHLQGLIKVQADDLVSLAHFSVQEYLAPHGRRLRTADNPWRIDTKLANLYIAQCCLAYIVHFETSINENADPYPLRTYAWMNWSRHLAAKTSGSTALGSTVRDSMRLYNKIAFPNIYDRRSQSQSQDEDDTLLAMATQALSDEARDQLIEILQAHTAQEFAQKKTGDIIRIQHPLSRNSGHEEYSLPWLPLPDYPETVRLLVLLPDPDRSSPIRCRLVTDTLDNHPQYDAMSYMWGNPSTDRYLVTVDGEAVSMLQNAYEALLQLRSDRLTVLWLDKLCIHMMDVEERSSQVGYMRAIYSQAVNVIVWLGPASPDSEEAMQLVQRPIAPSDNTSQGRYSSAQVALLDKLLSHPIWGRVWLVQELALAARLSIRWGSFLMDWDNMRLIADIQTDLPSCVHGSWSGMSSLQLIRARYRARGSLSFYELLYLSRMHHASNATDKIYSLLGLLPEPERSDSRLRPNYALSTQEVYTKATLYVLAKRRHLDILSQITNHSEISSSISIEDPGDSDSVTSDADTSREWPSWVLYWNPAYQNPSLQLVLRENGTDCSSLFSASGNTHLNLMTSGDQAILTVSGVFVGYIRTRFDNSAWTALHAATDEFGTNTTRMLSRFEFPMELWGRTYGNLDNISDAFKRTRHTDREILPDGTSRRIPPNDRHAIPEWKPYSVVPSHSVDPQASIFSTSTGYMGVCAIEPWISDAVVLLFGGKVPYILRRRTRKPEGWAFIADCYVHGIMDGELVPKDLDPTTCQTFDIV